jgi:hypothetical protein
MTAPPPAIAASVDAGAPAAGADTGTHKPPGGGVPKKPTKKQP